MHQATSSGTSSGLTDGGVSTTPESSGPSGSTKALRRSSAQSSCTCSANHMITGPNPNKHTKQVSHTSISNSSNRSSCTVTDKAVASRSRRTSSCNGCTIHLINLRPITHATQSVLGWARLVEPSFHKLRQAPQSPCILIHALAILQDSVLVIESRHSTQQQVDGGELHAWDLAGHPGHDCPEHNRIRPGIGNRLGDHHAR